MVRGITVCVQYDDLLARVLPRNLQHLDEVVVVTSPADLRTIELARQFSKVRLHITDAFYRYDAIFNKGLAMEEGFDVLGRHGWIMVFDADTVLPKTIDWSFLTPGFMYTPQRHILQRPDQWSEDLDWAVLPIRPENEWAGYCQVFHADDPLLARRRPWYGINWPHAGGCDSDFQQIWPGDKKLRPSFRVVHLGEDGKNWCGRVTGRIDGVELPEQTKRKALMHQILTSWPIRLRKLQMPRTN